MREARQSAAARSTLSGMSKPRPPSLPLRSSNARGEPVGYAISLGLVALVTLAGVSISGLGNITNVALLYLLPVLVAASRFGLRAGLVAGLASSLAYNFFFIPPLYTFTIADPQNLITLLVLMGVAILTSQQAARVREQAMLAKSAAEQSQALAGFASLLTGVARQDELGKVLCAEVGRLFGVRSVLLLPEGEALTLRSTFPPGDHLEPLEHATACWVFAHNRPAGRGSGTLTACEWLFYPILCGEKVLAVFGMAREDAGQPLSYDQRPLLASLLDQASLALERITLEGEMTKVAKLREQDRLRTALLSSVSHDLRTPLTTIMASLAEIAASDPQQGQQLAVARAEALRLNRFVANLLDMARIEAGALTRASEPVDLADAIASAADDLKTALADHPLRIDLPPDLPFVLVDPQLFHHCLINLIDNAAKYGPSGTPVAIVARRLEGGLVLQVLDEGPGLPDGSEARIFETFVRLEGSDRKGGSGLGLAIVKGFASAMGLGITAANRPDTLGACFTLSFDAEHLRMVGDNG